MQENSAPFTEKTKTVRSEKREGKKAKEKKPNQKRSIEPTRRRNEV